MKYQLEQIINLPLSQTIEKMDNADNMKHWQRGLVSHIHLSGEPGAKGAKMELQYNSGKRKITMVETIIKNDFPNSFDATYEAKGVYNLQQNTFEELPDGRTKWTSNAEFKFENFGLKAMAFLMPGVFKKQSQKYMNDFKAFAEEGISVAQDS